MKHRIAISAVSFCAAQASAQGYNRAPVCNPDTITVHFHHHKQIDQPTYTPDGSRFHSMGPYRALTCTQVSKLGFRAEIGYNTYSYPPAMQSWLGSSRGGIAGIAIVYGNFSIGARFKPATSRPRTALAFNGKILPQDSAINLVRSEYDISYSLHIGYNFSVEPYIALTSTRFHVLREDSMKVRYHIPSTLGITTGITLNKYFHLKDFRYIALFARYGYGLTNYRKVHPSLGPTYSDISFGVAWKGFAKRYFYRKL